jgi:hypothetical protein
VSQGEQQGLGTARREREDAQRQLVAAAALGAPTAGALIISFLFTPEQLESGQIVLSAPCLMKSVLGIGCPTCGMTRAFLSISHGDIPRAFHYNVLSPAVYALFWVLAIHAGVSLVRALRALWRSRRHLSAS